MRASVRVAAALAAAILVCLICPGCAPKGDSPEPPPAGGERPAHPAVSEASPHRAAPGDSRRPDPPAPAPARKREAGPRPERRPESAGGPTHFQRTVRACAGGEIPASPAARDGLERARAWRAAGWEDRALCRRFKVEKTGRTLMYLATGGGEKGKAGATLAVPLVLAEKGAVRLAAYNNSDAPVKLGVAFWTAPGGVYYESRPKDVPAGKWIELDFDLNAGDYKCKASEWRHTASLPAARRVGQVALLLHHGGKLCRVLVDGLTVDRVPQRDRPGRGRERPRRRGKPDESGKPEESEESEESDKPGKPDKPEEPDKEEKKAPQPEG
jgi:hypothetical protein